jgi:hypothetical protein
MSFETLKVSELKKVAEDFGVEVEGAKNKATIIAALTEEGVTWSVYAKTQNKTDEDEEDTSMEILPRFDPKKSNPEDTVLVKMDRANFRYDILGHTFTREHPFVAMDKDQAQAIFDNEGGFRLATPKEVQDFYN